MLYKVRISAAATHLIKGITGAKGLEAFVIVPRESTNCVVWKRIEGKSEHQIGAMVRKPVHCYA